MKALMKLDRPETWLAIHGYLIALLWEMLQMPFYAMGRLSAWETTINCSLASLGDAGIMVFAYFAAAWAVNDRYWLSSRNRKPVIVFLVTGLLITLVVDRSLRLAGRPAGGRNPYSSRRAQPRTRHRGIPRPDPLPAPRIPRPGISRTDQRKA